MEIIKRYLLEFMIALLVFSILGFILAIVKTSFYADGTFGVY